MSNRDSPNLTSSPDGGGAGGAGANHAHDQRSKPPGVSNLHRKSDSSSSRASSSSSSSTATNLILLTPYPVGPDHTLITIVRMSANEWGPEIRSSAQFVAEGDNAGIIINKKGNIMDYNKIQAGQKERQQPPSAKMSFKVFLINSATKELALEHRTLRFWLDHSPVIMSSSAGKGRNTSIDGNDNNNEDSFRSMRSYTNIKQESSQLVQAYFCQLIGSKPDDFPKNYIGFIMKLMRLLKSSQFSRIIKMEVEIRQLAQEDSQAKPPSPVCKYFL